MVTDADRFICANLVKKMFSHWCFSICEYDKALELMELPRPHFYDQLRKYHCIHYSDMPQGMRDELLGLVLQSLTMINPAELIDRAFATVSHNRAVSMLEVVAK